MNRSCVFVVLCCLSLARVSQAAEDSAANAFSQLKSLVGDWNGTYEWTGARTGAGPISAIYRLTGSGSALIEDLIMEGTPVMMSVYHLDGTNLRITHFCGAQNQPRLKAERIDLAHGVIDFGFIDITNLRAADAGHVHGLEIRLIDKNDLIVTFLFQGAGKESRERIVLKRAEKALGLSERRLRDRWVVDGNKRSSL